MECNICNIVMRYIVIPECHEEHTLCSSCYNKLHRADLKVKTVVDYALRGPENTENVVFERFLGDITSDMCIVYVEAKELVNEIISQLPTNYKYNLDPIKTSVEVEGLGRLNLLQYAVLNMNHDITMTHNNAEYIIRASSSLMYAMENDLDAYDIYNTYDAYKEELDRTLELIEKRDLSSNAINARMYYIEGDIKRYGRRGREFNDLSKIDTIALEKLVELEHIVKIGNVYYYYCYV